MNNIEDMALVAQVTLLHSERAFARLVDRYQGAMRRFFLVQTLGDTALSDDLAQDTFLRVWQGLPTFHATSSFRTWLYRVAYHVYLSHVRSQHPADALDAVAARSLPVSEPDASLGMDLVEAMRILSAEERLCVTLQLIDGHRIARVAQITGLCENTVKSHLSRGKHKMANYLRQNGYDRQ